MGSVGNDEAEASARASFVFRRRTVITTAHKYDHITLRCRGGELWRCQQSQRQRDQGTRERNQKLLGAINAREHSAAATAAAGVSAIPIAKIAQRNTESRGRSYKEKMYTNHPCCSRVSDTIRQLEIREMNY